jgi:Protein of unknown function (DUF4197)
VKKQLNKISLNINSMTIINKFTLAGAVIVFAACSQKQFDQTMKTAGDILNTGTTSGALSNGEVVSGLKEALALGTKNSAGLASKLDGFYKNPEIFIPFPPAAVKVKNAAMDLGLGSQVTKFETTLNRAAEEAAKEAVPIFVNAITSMSIADGFAILKGGKTAATDYLKTKTAAALKTSFQPKVKSAIAKVELTKYYTPLANAYNTSTLLTGAQTVNPDLENYVTDKAISGLFTLISKEETKIRDNPAARVTELLKKVFGSKT